VTGEFDVADNRQSFVGAFCVDADVTLSSNIVIIIIIIIVIITIIIVT